MVYLCQFLYDMLQFILCTHRHTSCCLCCYYNQNIGISQPNLRSAFVTVHLLFTVPCTLLQGIRPLAVRQLFNRLDALQLTAGYAVNCNPYMLQRKISSPYSLNFCRINDKIQERNRREVPPCRKQSGLAIRTLNK